MLGQTSKNSTLPKNYVAIVGDSYAVGYGDLWLRAKRDSKFSTPEYHSGHFLHREIKKDVVVWGDGGRGHFRTLISDAIGQFEYINSLWPYQLDKPDIVLVYFYEGNDVWDNYQEMRFFFSDNNNLDAILEPHFFQQQIKKKLLDNNPVIDQKAILRNLIFTRSIINGFKNLMRNYVKNLIDIAPQDKRPPPISKALIASKEYLLPVDIQAPPINLTKKEVELSLYGFEQAMLFFQNFFKSSEIKIIYIPSPLTSYNLVSKNVYYTGARDEKGLLAKSREIEENSSKVCQRVANVAKSLKVDFLDSRDSIREVAENNLIHGPIDWGHFNEKGYTALTNAIIQAFFSDAPNPSFQCKTFQKS